ncbi:TRAP transporter substrate-binding protein DctP [Stappia sp. ES.058]|uniref:TRAP transporter substrate-binding protein DctP n=1 Tax=Stappia sp. ES.058 TaxID=1881061 RepID=UPI00087C693B|nr:TRAP transporter substrate-binding protein DctP [Stappia sp. ES.058]SDU15472.1 TRAP-type C4-dicarboxylate transport system, substrate-binding protein [Stappia sp. ES.058]
MRKIVVLAGALVTGLLTGTAEARELRLLGSFPENFVFTREIAKPFIETLARETGGSLSVVFTGPDAVPGLEQFEPVQAGAFDMLFTHPAYHAGTTPVGLSIDAISTDPDKRRASGVIDFIDAHYRTLGMKLIAAPATGTKGFRYFLKEPVEGTPGLKGRKIRGTVSYHPMIEALGGSGVVMGGGDVYSALQTGVIDGAAWGLTGARDFKWNEVAGYMADPVFGQVGLMIFMNLDTWNDLTDEERATIERAAVELERDTIDRFDDLAVQEKSDLLELGMKMTSFSDEEGKDFDALWANGVWAVAEKSAPEPVGALRKLARDAELTD